MSIIRIRDVKAIATAPGGTNLLVVKVETTEPGLYGLGCATFAYRIKSVISVVEDYFKPLLQGRDVENIEDIWHLLNVNSYWRNGPITNNAISGIDMALWDIKGKMANMPVYKLLGGKARSGVRIYAHANGSTLEELADKVQMLKEKGLQVIRCQWGGTSSYGGCAAGPKCPRNVPEGLFLDPDLYSRNTVKMF
jgi:mannonate dehydratase